MEQGKAVLDQMTCHIMPKKTILGVMQTTQLFVLQIQGNNIIGFDSYIIWSSPLEIDSECLRATGVFVYLQFLNCRSSPPISLILKGKMIGWRRI